MFKELSSNGAQQCISGLSLYVVLSPKQPVFHPRNCLLRWSTLGQTPSMPMQRPLHWEARAQCSPSPVIDIANTTYKLPFEKKLLVLQGKNSRVKLQLLEEWSNCHYSGTTTRDVAIMTGLLQHRNVSETKWKPQWTLLM